MKAIDLLKYLDRADPMYVEEASDLSLLLYRKRRKRTRAALAASLVLVVLAGAFLTKPALYAWETRNTVASWSNTVHIPGTTVKPSPPVYISAEMPAKKRFSVNTPFTLSVGLGQRSSYEYATLSVEAYGFEITDKDGNTVTDRYVRTLLDFGSGDYGMQYRDGKNKGRVTGCSYLEDFTFRFLGSDKATGWGVIQFNLTGRDESGTAGDSVAVYYILQNGALKLTDKNPVRGDQNGTVLKEETQNGNVTLSKGDISVRVDMPSGALIRGEFLGDRFRITAFHIPTQKDYPTDNFTAELIYAESLRETDFSFCIKRPVSQNEDGSIVLLSPHVPEDAPMGSYDLIVRDGETGFAWVFENMALVLPAVISAVVPAYEDFTFESAAVTPILHQGDYWPSGGWDPFYLTLDGEDVAYQCRAELEYRTEQDGVFYSITVLESPTSSRVPPDFISVDAPAGWYDLVVTHEVYGYTWRVERFIEIRENPKAQRFGLYHTMGKRLTVSRSSEGVKALTAQVENRGEAFTVTVSNADRHAPEATLSFADTPEGSGEIFELPLRYATAHPLSPYEWTWQTGQLLLHSFEIMVTPDTPCGLYDLTLSYEDCTVTFEDVVEVVP